MSAPSRVGIGVLFVVAGAASLANAKSGPVAKMQMLSPGMSARSSSPGYSGTPLPQVVGLPFNVTVNLVDQNWNLSTSNTTPHTIQLSSSTDPNVSFPSGATASFTQSVAYSVIFGTAGAMTLTATDLTDPAVVPTTCPPALLQVLDHFTTSQIGQPGSNPLQVIAGTAFPVTVYAKDPSGVTVTGYHGTSNFSESASTGPGSAAPASATFSQGAWSGQATMYRADTTVVGGSGQANLKISEAVLSAVGLSNAVVVLPGTLNRLQILVPGESQNPGVSTSPGVFPGKLGTVQAQPVGAPFSMRVFGTDSFWNTVPGTTDAVYFSSSDPAASLPATSPGAAIPLSNGAGAWSVTLNTLGLQTITVFDASNSQISSNTSTQISVVSPGTRTPTPPPSTSTPIPQTATTTPTPAPGTSTPIPPTATVTPSPTSVGAPISTATQASVVAILPVGTFWNYPNPFSAGGEGTTFAYVLGSDQPATLQVYDPLGNLVCSMSFPASARGGSAGLNLIPWAGTDSHGRAAAPGSYVAILSAGGGRQAHRATRKLGIQP